MRKSVVALAVILLIVGCSTKPYTGEIVTTTVDPSGLVVTRTETRSILPGKVLAGSETESRHLTADVVATDPVTRQIVLRTVDNRTQTITAGDAVRNFAQIKASDTVNIDYFAAITFEVRPPSADEIEQAGATTAVFGRAPDGSRPAGIIGVGDIGILVIDAVDRPSQTVTLSGPGGSLLFRSSHPENLDLIKRGDTVVVKVAGLLAANISPQN